MTSRWWPLHGLRLTTGHLVLTAMTEADLDVVATVLPDDLELNPTATRYPGLPERTWRGTVVHQEYWRSMGTWSPDDWEVYLVVRRGADVLGVQGLEGPDFRTLRTVDTSSWLAAGVRGTGVGKAMRRAVLALAFDHLGARAAITSAWHDNHASLGVSRALGYRPNGESLMAREGTTGADTLVHLRMTRADWEATGGAPDVQVDGLEAALPLFALPS
jgi:RimJ/RimL family protein N-acetyltransferase